MTAKLTPYAYEDTARLMRRILQDWMLLAGDIVSHEGTWREIAHDCTLRLRELACILDTIHETNAIKGPGEFPSLSRFGNLDIWKQVIDQSAEKAMGAKGSGRRSQGLIPPETFATRGGIDLYRYASRRGWSWAQLAEHTGITVRSLRRLMKDRGPESVTVAEAFLLRDRCDIALQLWMEPAPLS